MPFVTAVQAIRSAIEVERCLLCAPKMQLINDHHLNAGKNVFKVMRTIQKCPKCKQLLKEIQVCALAGHVKGE